MTPHPIIIAHRGCSGERPEHTLASYDRAIDQGADYIEPDLVMTRDHILVARHENEISGTTNVADMPEFADRHITKLIDGKKVTGWFTEDFSFAELSRLSARERLPLLRPDNTAFDGQYGIPAFQEIIDLVRRREGETGRRIGIYPETKHPSYFRSIGLALEEPLLSILSTNGYSGRDAAIFIQSFEAGNLRALREQTDIRLIQLIEDSPDYAAMVTSDGLRGVADYADGVGPAKSLIIPLSILGKTKPPTAFVEHAHKAGLLVHPWTFRAENFFLPANMRSGINPRTHGDLKTEIQLFLELGVDGIFCDFPGIAREIIPPLS